MIQDIIAEARAMYATLEQALEAKILNHIGELDTQLEANRAKVTELFGLVDNYFRPTGNFKPEIPEGYQAEVRASAAARVVYSHFDGVHYASLQGWDLTDKVAASLLLQDPDTHYKTAMISPQDRRRLWAIAAPMASKAAQDALEELGQAEARVRRLTALRDQALAYTDTVTMIFPRSYMQ